MKKRTFQGFAKRALIPILALVLIFGSLTLAGCGGEEETEETETRFVEVETSEEQLPAPEVKKFGGREFNVLASGAGLWQPDETDSDIFAQSIVQRAAWLEETYDVTLGLLPYTGHGDYQALQNSYLGGMQAYDLIVPHPTVNLASIMASGMMQDLNDSEALGGHIDTKMPWWNQSQVTNFVVNGKLFFGVSDTYIRRGLSVLIMNLEKYKNMYDDDIYQIVYDGDWTIDLMSQLAKENYDEETGEFGYATNVNSGCCGLYYSCGETLLVRDTDGQWVHRYDKQKTQGIVEKAYQLLVGPQTLKEQWYNSSFATNPAWLAFGSRQILLLDMDLGAFGHLVRELDFDTAFLPQPKYDSEQEKYCTICGSGFIGIPNDVKDMECSALILEASNWFSYYECRPAYIDTYISYTVAKNPDDTKILNMVIDNTIYDLGFTLDNIGTSAGKGTGLIKYLVVDNMSNNSASYIAENESATNEKMQNFLKDIY